MASNNEATQNVQPNIFPSHPGPLQPPPQSNPLKRHPAEHQSTFTPENEHASLDTGIEEEENQFVNYDVFAELTLEDVKDTAGSGEAVAYRQVSGDHRTPAFFIRNPSLIYGLTQSGGAAFFQRASMEDEFRLPRIQTVQLALLILTSRPAINSGQNTILTARAIGTAQLIGLHVDPSDWKLPRWERNLRKRVMWGLIIHDLHNSNFSVTVPTMSDMDPDTHSTREEQDSMMAFCGMCRLTLILDELLMDFYSVRTSSSRHRGPSQLRLLEGISEDLDMFSKSLPDSFRIDRLKATPATGVRECTGSLQISQLGLGLTIVRLTLAALHNTPNADMGQALQMAFEACVPVVEFLEMITDVDAGMFWIPYAPYHVINCASLILRVMILAKRQDSPLRISCGNLLARMISTLTAAHHGYSWDVASLALDRIAIIIASVESELPEVSPLRTTFSQHIHQSAPLPARPAQAKTESRPSHAHATDSLPRQTTPADQIPIMSDSLWWMHNDITNFPENFDWTLDGFAQFAAHDATNAPNLF
ncbi:hypothetical protein QFC19_001029 [Naganishia cerealis]|uniref:Uncharacterized protein n=1 Tax=Naganishia cerealis TaxID=610337 RepID=A0ACC2WIU7_9TREE|nr:hypothetical protein QFC19_001029 [Naganishia cerealis]